MRTLKNLYDVLEVQRTADEETIKKAYRRLARELHPDLNGGDKAKAERFKEVQTAYAVLGNRDKRVEYDAMMKAASVHKPSQRSSLFGPMFDALVDRARTEGLHSGNLDSLIEDLIGVAIDVQKRAPEHVRNASKSPGQLLGMVESIFGAAITVGGEQRRDDEISRKNQKK